jgi:hypothetical protein
MSDNKPTTEVTQVSAEDIDNLLGFPGADSVMVPGETEKPAEKPSFFNNGKVDMDFIDEDNPPADPPVDPAPADPENPPADPVDPSDPPANPNEATSFSDLVDNLDGDDLDEDGKPKAGRPSLDKNGMAQLAKALIEDKVILPFDEDKALEDYTLDDYKELFSMNIQERERQVQEATPKEFFQSLPEELQYAAKYVADGGTDLKGLFRTLAAAEENKSISIDSPEGQERAVRQFLQASNFGTPEEIQEQIESWKDLEKLEDKANQFKPRLDAMQEQVIKRQLAEQEQKRKQREAASQQYADSVYNTLEKGELNGIKLNPKIQNMLYDGLINANYQSVSGSATNMFGHLIEKHQYIEPNHGLIAEALWLLQDPDGYRAEIKKGAKNAQVEETARQLKYEQANKGGSGDADPASAKTRRPSSGSTLKRQPKGFFKRD